MMNQLWSRPVPNIGDSTSATERASDPAGWAFSQTAINQLGDVIDARRDIRRFRPDPIPDELVQRVILAGHHGPSVGYSQPWRFILVRSQETRDKASLLADQQRVRHAALMPPDRAQRLLDLQLEGIREAPLGIIVACDRRTPAIGILGRATFHDADMWSCACAIQNMWLTARALGLGMGWVTLFEPQDLCDLVGIPEGVETLGWLCLGWPDERPPEPGLERAGWAKRLPLEEITMDDYWSDDSQPPTDWRYHDIHKDALGPKQEFVVSARDSSDRILGVPRALGVLDNAIDKTLSLGLENTRVGALVLATARHPVAEKHAVTAFDPTVADEVIAAARAGVAMGAVAARTAGLGFHLVETLVNGEQGDLVTQDAMERHDTERLVSDGEAAGKRLARDAIVALGEIGMGNTTIGAALTCALLDVPPEAAVGLGAASDQTMMETKMDVVRAALARSFSTYGDDMNDPMVVLSALGGPEFAYLTGVTLGAAKTGGLVVMDGLATSLAALLAVRINPGVQAHLLAGQQSRESAHPLVLSELGLEPLLTLRIRSGEGVGAVLATRLLLQGLEIRRSAAKTDS